VLREGLKILARDGSDDHEATRGMHCNRYTRRSLKRYLWRLGFVSISHHLFIPELPCWRCLMGTRWARKKAVRLGYPLRLPHALAREPYEGYSWRTHPALRPVRWFYLYFKHGSRRC
jgi:hypothetical protein